MLTDSSNIPLSTLHGKRVAAHPRIRSLAEPATIRVAHRRYFDVSSTNWVYGAVHGGFTHRYAFQHLRTSHHLIWVDVYTSSQYITGPLSCRLSDIPGRHGEIKHR
jgi:hypothetical protein